ncbi:MAG TPA: ATP-dependent RNA helicase HrpA, partial [Pirellulaceae bacterium]
MDVSPAAQIEQAMLRDRARLRSLLDRRATSDPRRGMRFHDLLQRSLEIAEQRRQGRPQVRYELDLPILAHKDSILSAIREHPLIVVAGETGSGKSTQLPKFLLEAGFGIYGMIGHTQPRRIAARGIAARLSDELQSEPGTHVGFKIRFTDRTSDITLIKLMTDGILLAETQGDRYLEAYEALIIDEAHERSLNIDFLIGYLRRLLTRRPELRVVITSATIDAERFSAHFGRDGEPAPVIRVSGRTYPVDLRYRPLVSDDGREACDLEDGLVEAIKELAAIDEGHILVFLPTERDIRELARRLRGEFRGLAGRDAAEILPLYARLSAAEQQRIFRPQPGRRIVLATNVAESSLTVPGIKYVVDSGLARISRYSPRSKVQRLPIEAISRASADQRAGRCGRLSPGICIRLFSAEDYAGRKEFGTPEILRTNLAWVILRAMALNLGRVEDFPFLDPPRSDMIQDGYRTLFEIQALDTERRLTPLGSELARLPVDPRIARILLAADREDCLREMLIIAAALEIQDPRERPLERQQAADECHAKFRDERSDFLGLLRVWDFYHGLKERLSRNQLQRACGSNFLSFVRLREWSEIHRQLQELIRDVVSGRRRVSAPAMEPSGTETSDGSARPLWDPTPERNAAIHRALLTGFLSGVAWRKGRVEYTGAGGIAFHLWPGSGLFEAKPPWCLVAEIVETSRRYGRTVARIDPEWVEPLADHLVKRSYSEPHWSDKRAAVMAYERVTLFGLPVVPRRLVSYGVIDPESARPIFLRDGLRHERPLKTGEWTGSDVEERLSGAAPSRSAATAWQQFTATDQGRLVQTERRTDRLAAEPFYRHNEQVLRTAAKLAARSRRADLLIDEFALYRFYDARIPHDVNDLASLKRWQREIG